MKVFHCDKYRYIGIQNCRGRAYHAFLCTKIHFKEEIVLVREAKVTYPNGKAVFFDESQLDDEKVELAKGQA